MPQASCSTCSSAFITPLTCSSRDSDVAFWCKTDQSDQKVEKRFSEILAFHYELLAVRARSSTGAQPS